MIKFITFCCLGVSILSANAAEPFYSTEATVTVNKQKGTYSAVVRATKTFEKDGKIVEEEIGAPRASGGLGVQAFIAQQNDANKEQIEAVVFCPKTTDNEFASCAVTVKQGDVIVAKSLLKVRMNE